MILVSLVARAAFAIGGDDADTQLSIVIAALVALAVVILIATVVYWRMTKPLPNRRRTVSQTDDNES